MKAQEVFDYGEALREEARRARDIARKTYDRLAAVNPRDFWTKAAWLRELDDTNKTQGVLQRGTQIEALEEAERARGRASVEVFKALNAVSTAKSWAERELEEAKRLTAVAESFMESAKNEQIDAESVLRELFVDDEDMRRVLEGLGFTEVGAQQGVSTHRDQGYQELRDLNGGQESEIQSEQGDTASDWPANTFPSLIREPSGVIGPATSEGSQVSPHKPEDWAAQSGDSAGGSESVEVASSLPEDSELLEPPPDCVQDLVIDSAGIVDEGLLLGELAALRRSIASIRQVRDPSQGTTPSEDPQQDQPEIGDQGQPAASDPQPMDQPAVAAGLKLDIQAPSISSPRSTLDVVTDPKSARGDEVGPPSPPEQHLEPLELRDQPGTNDAQGSQSLTPAVVAPPESDPGEEVSLPVRPQQHPETVELRDQPGPADRPGQAVSPGASDPGTGMNPPGTCTGRVSLVFLPCPDAVTLGSFWEVLDGIAGIGGVVDAQPLDDGSGFDFTLDLGDQVLEIENLMGRIPNSQIVAMGEDKLNVRWSPE